MDDDRRDRDDEFELVGEMYRCEARLQESRHVARRRLQLRDMAEQRLQNTARYARLAAKCRADKRAVADDLLYG